MGKDTLSKYIKNGLPFKGKIFSRNKKTLKIKYCPIVK